MKRRRSLSDKNLPRKLPIIHLMVYWLLLDRLHASAWAWGVVGTLMVIVMIGSLIDFFTAQDFEITQ